MNAKTNATKIFELVRGDRAPYQPAYQNRPSTPSFLNGITMSGSSVKGHSDLFTEARLPPGLLTRVTELGRHMKPLVEAATGQSPYTIVECAAGDEAVEYIYEQYTEIVAKVRAQSECLELY